MLELENAVDKVDSTESAKDDTKWQEREGGDELVGEMEDDFYFDYEEEMKRQEEIMLEKFGRHFQLGNAEDGFPLQKEMIGSGLSNIGRPVDTTRMAYLTFTGSSKNLNDLNELMSYIHLTTVIVSDNKLRSLYSLKKMRNLKVLNAERNLIETLDEVPLHKFKWLQALNLGANKLNSLEGMQPNSIMYLHLAKNNLDSVDYFTSEYFPNLLSLELRGNQLRTIEGIYLPKLRHLYIAENQLENLNGINGCPSLEVLHARRNLIMEVTIWPTMEKLEYLNLKENHIQHFTQTTNLENCPNLKVIILLENPLAQSQRYKNEIIAACNSLERLDKMRLTDLDIVEGRRLRSGRENGTIPRLEDDPAVLVGGSDERQGEQDLVEDDLPEPFVD